MLCLTMMEWDSAETKADFKAYAERYYPTMKGTELIVQVNNWPNYL